MSSHSQLPLTIIIFALTIFLTPVSSKGIRDHLFFQAWPNLLPSTSGQSTTTSPNPSTTNTATTSTTQTPATTQVVVEDKNLFPGFPGLPPTLQDILNYLLKNIPHWNPNKVENISDKAGNAEVTSAATSTSPSARPTTESSTQTTQSTTTVITSTSTTTSTTTSPTTSASTSTATPGNTTTNRPGMLPFPTEEQAQVRDRVSKQLNDLLWSNFMRPPITDYKVTPRSRSSDSEGNIPFAAETPQQPTLRTDTSSRPQTTSGQRPFNVDIKPNGAVFIRNNNQQTAAPVRGVAEGDKGGFNFPDVQDKPYYGTNLAQYFTEPTASYTGLGSFGKIPFPARVKRAAAQGVSCQDPSQHKSCDYYPGCFNQLEGKCSSRESYLGDDAHRFCVRSMEAVSRNVSAGSAVVSSYFKAVFQCLNERMSYVLESPTCSDMTSTLVDALHVSSRSSCLFLGERLCDVINDDAARPHLIWILYEPCNDDYFMKLLLVNSMKLARMCHGPGVGIFTTDSVYLAKSRQSVFRDTFSNTPVPGVQARS